MAKTTEQPTNKPPKNKGYYSQTIWVIVPCGIFGFFLSVVFLLGFSKNKRFHEISVELYRVSDAGVDSAEAHLNKQIKSITEYRNILKAQKSADTSLADAKIDSINTILYSIKESRYHQLFGNKDTIALTDTKYSIRRDSLLNAINRFETDSVINLDFGYYNPEYAKQSFPIKAVMKNRDFNSPYKFFSKYPNFAFWMFIGVLQMVIWWLIGPICISLFGKVDKFSVRHDRANETKAEEQLSDLKKQNLYRWYKSIGIAAGAVIIFCLILFVGVIKEFMITDKYFMDGFRWKIGVYIVIGYGVAILCFAGFLYIADFMHRLQNSYIYRKAKQKVLNAKRKPTETKDEAEDPTVSQEINENNEDIDIIKEKYGIAKKHFNLFLIMTSIVLSIVVFWIATLYSSINSMDIFRYYREIGGGSFLSGDFVYLFGGLNSLLLLIFFLPVKLNMLSAGMAIPQLQESTEVPDNARVKEMAKSFGKSLGEILVIASPLLTSLLQNLLGSI